MYYVLYESIVVRAIGRGTQVVHGRRQLVPQGV